MRRKIEPSVAAKIESAMNLSRCVVSFWECERFTDVGQSAQILGRGIVFVDECVTGGSEMIANRGIVFSIRRDTVAPDRPWLAWVILAREKHKFNGGRTLRNCDAAWKAGWSFQQFSTV